MTKKTHSTREEAVAVTVADPKIIDTVGVHLTEDERRHLTTLCDDLASLEIAALGRNEGPEAATYAAERDALHKLMYLPASVIRSTTPDERDGGATVSVGRWWSWQQEISDYLSSRPTRISECDACGGTGKACISYTLRYDGRPDYLIAERALGMVTVQAVGSSSISDCCREAAEIAAGTMRSVAFQFNGRVVVVRVGDDPDTVTRLWWMKVYGETPEESAKKR